ncbi:MAG: adenylosuccinate lyase [Phycisphaeraceae bacterium]|nr:adenylosuccinate lyase [Phycisphaeraceae bacterium]
MPDASRYDTYASPLAERNASPEMLRLWSPRHKFNTWRRIWLAVAEAQHELTTGGSPLPSPSSGEMGVPPFSTPPPPGTALQPVQPLVTREQVEELRAVVSRGITDDEIRLAEKYERDLRHDVMAHVHALGDACPKARPIIHLGMTSQDVVCNADLNTLFASLKLLETKVFRVVEAFASVAGQHAQTPTLGFTHYQAAQPITVGRRLTQWAYDLDLARERAKSTLCSLRLRGLRGATGSQASFDALLGSNTESGPTVFEYKAMQRFRVDPLLDRAFELTAQTYPRVIDTFILADLAAIAAVLHKIATDIRLLCNRKELDEPFETKQIGSSAMPYKRNPMRCERICGLTRFVMNLVGNAYDTAATQWLERTLDDSSNRRLSLPEAFLALDGALDLMHNVASGLIVHEAMVRKNLMAELPFLATENILMAAVKAGGDRQHYHELIRSHAQAAGMRVKHEGLDNDLLERLRNDPNFWSASRGGPLREELNWEGLMDPMKYIGRSVEQTERFIAEVVEPLREQYKDALDNLGDSSPRV